LTDRHPVADAFLATMAEAGATETASFAETLRRATATALHEVGGLSRLVVRITRRPNRNMLEIKLDGWSPTLHRVAMGQLLDLSRGPHGHMTRDLVQRVGRIVDLLERRAVAGAALGLRHPDEAGTFPDPSRLHMDLALARMTATPSACRSRASGATARVHAHSAATYTPYSFTSHLSNQGDVVAERADDEGRTLREAGWKFRVPGAEAAVYDGHILTIKTQPVPVTVSSAMPGRRLGDLVRIHPGIDDYVVRDMHVDQLEPRLDLMTFTFERTVVPLATLDWGDLR
jgi:hypothetical protein